MVLVSLITNTTGSSSLLALNERHAIHNSLQSGATSTLSTFDYYTDRIR